MPAAAKNSRIASYVLNAKEKAVLDAFPKPRGDEEAKPINLADLARDAFPKKGAAPTTKGNSWTRNSVRKLLRLGLVKHVDDVKGGSKSGLYRRTKKTPDDVIPAVVKKKIAEQQASAAA